MADNWQDTVFGNPVTDYRATPRLPAVLTPITPGGSAYGAKALAEECATLAATTSGRNNQLNKAAFNIASLVEAGHLGRQQAIDALTSAAHTASARGDHPLTDHEIDATLRSAFRGSGEKVGARAVPERPPLDLAVTTIDPAAPAAPLFAPAPPKGITNGTNGANGATNGHPADTLEPTDEPESFFGTHPPQDGAAFLFDSEDTTVALWGDGDEILWAEGEALMIAGGMGLGKTTLAGQILRAQLGLNPTDVLGLPVAEVTSGPILYLAMDRPRQIRRSMLRQFTEDERDRISGRLLIRIGPPIADLAVYPGLLAAMAAEVGAAVIYVDSLKDAAIGLSDDKVGAAYNRARQQVLADNRQICELHHNRKTISGAGGGGPGGVSDVYGSTWLTSGAGSVIMLTGEPGDPIIEFRHVKQPLNEVGPWRLLNNSDAGRMAVDHQVDLLELAKANRTNGLTAQAAAGVLFDREKPTRAEVEKARYRLDKLANQGLLYCADGMRGGANGGSQAAWFPAANS